MAAISSKVPALRQQSSVKTSLFPASESELAFTVKDLQNLLRETMEKQTQQFVEILEKKLEEKFTEKLTEMRADITSAMLSMAKGIEILDERVEDLAQNDIRLEAKMSETEIMVEEMDYTLISTQYYQMEFALRIRGLNENSKENLKEMVSEALEGVLKRPADEIMQDIDKIFRVNSWIARQRKLPRDVVVYFTKRMIRNEVIQASYNTDIVIAEQKVLILKEIPAKILRKRKEFAFLTQELRRRDIKFRWQIPVGMVVTYEGTRYCFTTEIQAHDFYSNVLKAVPIPSLESTKKKGERESQRFRENPQVAEGLTQTDVKEALVGQISLSLEKVRNWKRRATSGRMNQA